MPGNTTYVAGFVQGSVGDTSPNTCAVHHCISPLLLYSLSVVYPRLGAFCESPGKPYDGLPCVANSSTCGERVQECHGRGPAFTEDAYGFASSAEIGARQARAAGAILRRGTGDGMTPVVGSVRSVHVYVDMSRYGFALGNGTRVRTCPAAMGESTWFFFFLFFFLVQDVPS
jgi:neutral ceramidase